MVSESSELVAEEASSFDRDEPNTALRIFHRFFGGLSVSETASTFEELVFEAWLGADWGSTRSKDIKRFEGVIGLSHRIMIIRRPGAGIQGAEDNGAARPLSALV